MSDWGDDQDWDLEALEAAEQQALAQRQQEATAGAATAPAVAKPSAAPAQQKQPQATEPEPQKQLQRAEGPPRTAADLCRRCQLFRQAPPPIPRPNVDSCPGVYGRGCGGAIKLVHWGGGSGFFWACSNYPDCAYREFPPPRKLTPELSITLDRRQRTLAVAPATGAEDAVAWCGGVTAVLQVAGVDLRRALSLPAVRPAAAPAALPQAAAAPANGAAAAPANGAAAAPIADAPVAQAVDNEGPAGAAPAAAAAAQEAAASLQGELQGAGGDAIALASATGQPAQAVQSAAADPARSEPAAAAATVQPGVPPAEAPQPVVFPLHEYERLSSQLQQFSRQFGVCLLSVTGLVPPATLKAARGALRMLPSLGQVQQLYARMPPFLEAALLPFQREGVLFGLARNGRCLIADEMGVGKTVQAIALASCYKEEWPLLIIVPASLRLVWAEELEKWLPFLRPSTIHVIEGKEDRVAQGSVPLVTITSYEMMQRLTCDACKGRGGLHVSMCAGSRPPCRDTQNCMASLRWQVVIVDESHTLRTSSKAPDALHTEAVVSAVKLAKRAILLTGTPSLSRPFDLFRQVDAVMPGLLGRSRIEYASSYCNRREVPLPGFHQPGERCMRYDVSGLSRGAELHEMLKAEVMLRRLKRDVLSQLPPKRRQVIRLPKPPASEWPKLATGQRRHADDSDGTASSDGESEGEGEEGATAGEDGTVGGKAPAKGVSAAHRTGIAKASSVIEWLVTALGVRSGRRGGGGAGRAQAPAEDEEGDGAASSDVHSAGAPKFLVFAHHKTVMNRLAAALEGATGYAPVGYVRIDGGTDPEDRRAATRRFHADATIRVALLSVTAAGVGLDFSCASVVVFAELPDEVASVRQAEDRAHRQGQRQPVNIYFLCAKGTTDDRRWQHLNRSLARVAAVHDGAGLPAAPGEASGDAAAAGAAQQGSREGQQPGAVDAQAGLLVECVHDAEVAGLTPAAARAGLAYGLQGGTQTGESPLPAPAAAAVGMCDAAAAPATTLEGDAFGSQVAFATPGSVFLDEAGSSPGEMVPPTTEPKPAGGPPANTSSPLAEEPAAGQPRAAGVPSPAAAAAAAAGCAEHHSSLQLADLRATMPARQPDGAASPAAAAAAGWAGSPPGSARRSGPLRGRRSPPAVVAAPPAAPNRLPKDQQGRAHQPQEPAEPLEVWFEVSKNTNRVHLHADADGSAPLRLSLPMEALLAGDSPPLEELLAAVSLDRGPLPADASTAQQQQQQQEPGDRPAQPTAGAAGTDAAAAAAGAVDVVAPQEGQLRRAPAVVGGISVLALDNHISAAQLAAMLAEAREFAAEWRELRGLHQSRLQGKVLRAPLQEAVEEVDLAAAAAGKLGTSTERFVDAQQRADLALPAGAEWRTVTVAFKRYARESQYQQPFMPDGARLCINCAKPVPGKVAAQPAQAVLDGMTNLFCSGECEGRFALKSNGSAYRRALFKLERGICVACRLDCHTLAKTLQAVEKGSRGWEEQRRRIIAARAPRLMGRGYKAHLDLLVRRAVEGNAWQADHIVAVYNGGGLCDVDNLRTLCVACHADVTREQVKERAARRQETKAAKPCGGTAAGGSGWHDLEREAAHEAGLQGGEGGGGQPVVKRRKKLQRLFCDDTDSDSAEPGLPKGQQRTAGTAAAKPPAVGRSKPAPAQPRLRRNKLKPLFIGSESEEVEGGEVEGAAAAAAGNSNGRDGGAEQPGARLHRLSRGSTADEVPGGVIPLGTRAANATGNAGTRQGGAKKRPRAAAAGAAGTAAARAGAGEAGGNGGSRPKLKQSIGGGGCVVIVEEEDSES